MAYLKTVSYTHLDVYKRQVQEVVISGCLGKRGNRPFYSKKERETAAVNMERLGITDLRKSCYRDLSGGQKQRTLIARALCATDRLLILDEPITGLDLSLIHISLDHFPPSGDWFIRSTRTLLLEPLFSLRSFTVNLPGSLV